MKILEAIDKVKFRELAKRLHPDNKETGNEELMKKLNLIKNDEIAFNKLYNEIKGIKASPKEEPSKKGHFYEKMKERMDKEEEATRPSRFKTDKEWHEWHAKIVAARKKKQDEERKKQRG